VQVYYTPAFLRLFSKLGDPVKMAVKDTVSQVIDLYETGDKSVGLGIKRLRGDLWEARSGLKIRVVYSMNEDEVRFLLAGTHDDVRKFLKRA
jgi:mRNA-degrading endonuclease RelE of RelBE toxin-antitoxin system